MGAVPGQVILRENSHMHDGSGTLEPGSTVGVRSGKDMAKWLDF